MIDIKTIAGIPAFSKEQFMTVPGSYTATLVDVYEVDRPFKKQTDTTIKCKFRIENAPDGKAYYAARGFPNSLSEHSILRTTLKDWRGNDIIEEITENGEIHLKKLIGSPCDLQLITFDNKDFTEPFAYPAKILPVGTLVKSPVKTHSPTEPKMAPLKKREY